MAKASGPLMSMDASGTFGKTLTFGKWKGRNTVRLRVTPANPRTAGQQAAREALSAGGKFNKYVEMASPAQVALRDAAPSGQSGPSYFSKLQAERYAASKTAYNTGGNAAIKALFDAAATETGVLPVTIPGDTPVVIPAGLIMWNAYSAMNDVDPSIATTEAVVATETSINTFQTALNAA